MKALIWIGCFTLHYIISNIAKALSFLIPIPNDQALIFIPLLTGILVAASFGFSWWIAITLCKKWDWYTVLKKASEAGMTVSEYGRHGLSEEFLTKLETMCNTISYEQVKAQLKACIKKGKITKEQYIILLREYTTTK